MKTSTSKNKIARAATLPLLMLLSAANAMAQTRWQGNGTEQNPYLINSTAQLEALADSVNSGTTYEGQFFLLDADLTYDTATQNNHTAIGTNANRFRGTFDGNNHTISGIRISGFKDYQGLFGYCENGTVKNLILTDAKITISFNYFVGGIVGYNLNSSIEDCQVANNVTIDGGYLYVGGIAGGNSGSSIEDCQVANNVTVSGYKYIGGIAGINLNGSSIEDCQVANNVTISGSQNVGGIAGFISNNFLGSSIEFCQVTNNVTISGDTHYGTIVGYIEGNFSTFQRNYYLGCTVNGVANATNVGTGDGDITENDGAVSGYTIYTTTDWDFFCNALQDNDTWNRFIGDTVRLAADITVTRMAGSSTHDFMGTFDGQGHTLTVAYGTAENPINENYAAPFRYVETGAVIHSLHVEGHIYTSNQYASGVVGCQYGTVSVSNCRSSVIIHSSINGNGTHGGIVAVQHGGTLTMSGCVYDGRLLTTNGTTLCSGLVGWRYGTCTLSDCLYAPAEVTQALGETYITDGATLCRNYSGTPANCYYTETLGAAQGKLAHSITPDEGILMEMAGEATEYDISDITSYGTGIMYDSVLYAGNGDQVSLNLMAPEGFSIVSATYTPEGGMATELTPVNGVYSFTMPNADVVINTVMESSFWPGQGTEQIPYIITTTGQLETLAQLVNNGNGMAGKFFRLDADLTYDTLTQNNHTAIGTVANRFRGTFDGDGHTISGIRISGNNHYQGLFGFCQNSTLKNLILTDAKITGGSDVGGIVGYSYGGCSVENCLVANNVIVSASGYVGGIVGYNTESSIKDCQVANNVTVGSFVAGGIVGLNWDGSIEDCQVANNVTVSGSSIVGGIVGDNIDASNVKDCQVANNVTVSGSSIYGHIGGIAGENEEESNIEDCQVANNVTISGNSNYGTIVGYNENSTLLRNYYLGCTVNGVANATNVGTYYGDITQNNGAVPGYLLTLGEHITSNAYAFTIPAYGEMPETTYHVAPSGDTITLGYELAGCEVTYYVNDEAIADSTFTMPAANVSITATWEYIIHNATEWNNFCDALQDNDTWNRFIGKTVRLANDITVTRMAGSDYHDFMGTFDGQGHTLTIAYGTADNPLTEEYAAPFRNLENGAVIHSLHVDGHIYTSDKYASGIAGCQWGTVSVSDCRSSVVIHSSKSGDGTHGGIVAVHHGTLTVNGCVFDGRLLTTNGTTLCAGFVGWRYGTCTLSDCLYAPATDVTLAEGERYITNGATFCRNYSSTLANCYYTETLSTTQGKLALTDPAVLPEGEPTATYDVSNLTFYGNGVQFGEVFYYESEEAMQMIELVAGWNWYSTNVEITLNELKAALATALPGTVITIKAQDKQSTTLAGTTWRGNLRTMDVAKMYMISVTANCSFTLEGMPIDPAEHPITIEPGANWIGFPLSESMSLTNAFAGFNAANGDVIKAKNLQSATYNGTQWRGTLNTLLPGQGYIYKSNSTETKSFTFPTSTK